MRAFQVCETGDHPDDAVFKRTGALRRGPIVMVSQGRNGIAVVLLGSETRKGVTHETAYT